MNYYLNNAILSATSSEVSWQHGTLTITPARDSKITLYISNQFPAFTAQNIVVNFLAPGAEVVIYGLYRMEDKQNLAIRTYMNHQVPHCRSQQQWRGVLAGQAKVDFEGCIAVKPEAQHSVAHLNNKNLLLSNTAEISAKPFLEINADDVQCTHGATVGFLDQAAIFYLRSRGIAEKMAHTILVDAFVKEVMDPLLIEDTPITH